MYSLINAGTPCCRSCKFFRPVDVAEETDTQIEVIDPDATPDDVGRCVRFPPMFFHIGLLNAEFPVVAATTWCGEFKRDFE